MTAVLVPLFLASGSIDETRALSLLFPFLFVVAVRGVLQIFQPSLVTLTTEASALAHLPTRFVRPNGLASDEPEPSTKA